MFKLFPAYEQPYEPPQLIQIYFDTATFDQIERDVKVLTKSILNLIEANRAMKFNT